jgi:hypothetical protein
MQWLKAKAVWSVLRSIKSHQLGLGVKGTTGMSYDALPPENGYLNVVLPF